MNGLIKIIDAVGLSADDIMKVLNKRSQLDMEDERLTVSEIIGNVRENGDAALIDYSIKFDDCQFTSADDMIVTADEIDEAAKKAGDRFNTIIKRAADRITKFHAHQKRDTWITTDEIGVTLGQKITPMERVGIYVPGGRAAYPSSVLMNAIPAKVAGVKEIIMVTPPDSDGNVNNPMTLAAAKAAGVNKIYKIGGAQAIAALAYGTDTIPKVDKIVGPGNIYVTLAKKEVYGRVDIDMIAGPSEVLVVADDSAKAKWVAADLLSQAEHDPLASSILVTNCRKLADEVIEELDIQLKVLPKEAIARESIENYGAVIIVDDIIKAVEMANLIAPEHLELSVENPWNLLDKVKNAGAIFMGHYTPEPIGDYMAGPNHVLPTSGTARFYSPLGVDDFIKKSSILMFDENSLADLADDVIDFAEYEGLTAHANSIRVRKSKLI